MRSASQLQVHSQRTVQAYRAWLSSEPKPVTHASGGGSGAATAKPAIITARALGQPNLYSAVDAQVSAQGGWSTASGGDTYENVYSAEEANSQFGGAPLEIGAKVLIWEAPGQSGTYLCLNHQYAGVYPAAVGS